MLLELGTPGSDSYRSGLMFYCRCFFSTQDLQGPWADRCEILHRGL